jgi:Domain of unknown function (DUF4145)/Type I restriction modification DNA specificity domain
MTGSAGQRRVPKMFLEELEIPLPPLDEQKRIAAILDQADELRRLRQRGIDRLNELGQAIFSETFAAESSGSQTWPERTISKLADILVGFPFKSAHYIQSGRKIRLCRGANVLPGQIAWSDVAYLDEKRRSEFPLYELQSSDIVIAMDRPWISSGFKVAQIISEDTPSLLVQRVARIRSKQPEDSDFLFFLVRNPLFMSQFAFLQAEFSPVYDHARKAEGVALSDPRAACFYARLALETAVKWMYERDKALRTPYDDALSALIHEPSFRTVVGDARVTKARIIKDLGNRAVHDIRAVASQSAAIALRELFHFSYWLVRTYAKGTKPDAFPRSASHPSG